jgi:type II restriction/modification system DNA methylase subunit YeeA
MITRGLHQHFGKNLPANFHRGNRPVAVVEEEEEDVYGIHDYDVDLELLRQVQMEEDDG